MSGKDVKLYENKKVQDIKEQSEFVWELSEREVEILNKLNNQ